MLIYKTSFKRYHFDIGFFSRISMISVQQNLRKPNSSSGVNCLVCDAVAGNGDNIAAPRVLTSVNRCSLVSRRR